MARVRKLFRRNTPAPATPSPASNTSSFRRPASRQEQLENRVPHIGEVIRVDYERLQGQPKGSLAPVLYYATDAERINQRLSKIAYSALLTNAKKYEGAGEEFEMDILRRYDEEIRKIMADPGLQGTDHRTKKKKKTKLESIRTRMNQVVRKWRILLWYDDRTTQNLVVKAILTHRDVFMGQRHHKTASAPKTEQAGNGAQQNGETKHSSRAGKDKAANPSVNSG